MKHKIQTLLADMNTGLVDREHAIKAALLSVLAAENLVLIGPPGTAKSQVSRRVAQHIQTGDIQHPQAGESSYFEYLLTKFSTPEEIFGPLSISELKADRFRRNTTGYLPTVQVAFLDEIFKASSSILNALLTILNERIFHNGNAPQRVPLRSLISASNELPTGQEELSALYDRFLMRTFVGPVRDDQLHRLFDTPGAPHHASTQLTPNDLQAVDAAAPQVTVPPEVGEAVRGIWAAHKEAFKEDRREYLSDRRLVKLLKLLRVSAATNGRTEVDLSDAMLLQHCLWNHPDNMDKVREIVVTTLQRHSCMVPVDDDGTAGDGVYVVGSDGKELVQQTPGHRQHPPRAPHPNATAGHALAVQPNHLLATANRTVPTTATLLPARTKTKGFVGSGTAQDPICIGSAEDLVSMDDPDISLAGYHFVQTADIDCAAISHWPVFAFKGHYNGNGKVIGNVLKSGSQAPAVFSTLQATSSVSHLWLKNCHLAHAVEDSRLEHCQVTGSHLVGGNVVGSRLEHCQVTGSHFVGGNVVGTQIVACCVTGGALVKSETRDSQIADCQVAGDYLVSTMKNTQIDRCHVEGRFLTGNCVKQSRISDCSVLTLIENVERSFGLIASELSNSTVERCFAAGSIAVKSGESNVLTAGIAHACEAGIIRQCAVGLIQHIPGGGGFSLSAQLTGRANTFSRVVCRSDGSSTLQNNASIDTNRGTDDPNGLDGKTVAAARFNQRFFEHSLGWDFDSVWQWDATHNHPTLRFGANVSQASGQNATNAATETSGVPLEDLLTRQVQANIWL
jgi:MoxR-like ATPase